MMCFSFSLWVDLLIISWKIFISPPRWKDSLSYFDGFEDSQVFDLSRHIIPINRPRHLPFVGLDASDKVVCRLWKLSDQSVNVLAKLIENGLVRLFLDESSVWKQSGADRVYLRSKLVLVLGLESFSWIRDKTRRMPYLKNRCISDIKVHPWMLFELLIDGRNHISFLEKLCCSLFIDDLKNFSKHSDYLFVRWLLDVFQLIFKPIFSQDHHLTFEYLVVVLLE